MDPKLVFMVVTGSTFWLCTGSDAIDANDEAGRIARSRDVEASVARLIRMSFADRRLNLGPAST
jgi:hypothetical protein